MEYTCHTIYDQKALSAMARALRKTVRKTSTRRVRILGWAIFALAGLMLVLSDGSLVSKVLDGIAMVLILVVQVWGDAINGWVAKRRILPGAELCSTQFYTDYYASKAAGASTRWEYGSIVAVVESRDYFFFILGKNHAQAYQKSQLKGGTVDGFRSFLEQRTGKAVEQIGG